MAKKSFVQCSAMFLLAAASGELIAEDAPRRSTSAVSTASARCQIKMAHLLSLLQLCICSLVVVVAVVAVAAAVAAVAAKTTCCCCRCQNHLLGRSYRIFDARHYTAGVRREIGWEFAPQKQDWDDQFAKALCDLV